MKTLLLATLTIALSDAPTLTACGIDHACPAGWYAAAYAYDAYCGPARDAAGNNATVCRRVPEAR